MPPSLDIAFDSIPRLVACFVPWLVALAWLGRAVDSLAHAGAIPDLLRLPEPEPLPADGAPVVSVIVPACNEQDAIANTVRSLLRSRGVPLEVIAVDDRSTDATPTILDELALAYTENLRVVHVRELPAGWLGKPHALAAGTAMARAPFLLFTDADVLFREDALLRALGLMQRERLDHLVLAATPITRSAGEKMMIAALQIVSALPMRLWKVADPHARESIGVGSFGLVRREALEAMGGWQTLRMEVLEDLRLGWEIKRRLRLRQGIAFGRDLLRLHWGKGVSGIAGNLTKNGYALFRYRLPLACAGLLGLGVFVLAPIAALDGPPAARWAFVPFTVAIVLLGRRGSRHTGIPLGYALLFPVGAAVFLFALARSVALTLLRGGVLWRGTLYPLDTLRKHAGRLR